MTSDAPAPPCAAPSPPPRAAVLNALLVNPQAIGVAVDRHSQLAMARSFPVGPAVGVATRIDALDLMPTSFDLRRERVDDSQRARQLSPRDLLDRGALTQLPPDAVIATHSSRNLELALGDRGSRSITQGDLELITDPGDREVLALRHLAERLCSVGPLTVVDPRTLVGTRSVPFAATTSWTSFAVFDSRGLVPAFPGWAPDLTPSDSPSGAIPSSLS